MFRRKDSMREAIVFSRSSMFGAVGLSLAEHDDHVLCFRLQVDRRVDIVAKIVEPDALKLRHIAQQALL